MRLIRLTFFIAFIIFFASCASTRKSIYFKDSVAVDSSVQIQSLEPRPETLIQPQDILAINVTSISSILVEKSNPVSIFNEGGTHFNLSAANTAGSSASNNGYLVDENGNIDFPVIGKLKISGLTVRQVKDLIEDKLKLVIKEPVVEARIINYKVTVLGEVGHPGEVIAANQKINIIDALAASGDVPITGRKDNITIIRENNGKREFARLDMNNRNVFQSPYFNLKQNDIVIVEPSKVKRQENNEFIRYYLPVITALLTTIVAVYGLTRIK